MPKRRYERRESIHEWSQIRPLLKDTTQIKYELIRPVILWGADVKEWVAETGEPRSTIYYQANLFDQAGMASLLPPEPPPLVPKLDKRTLPPPIRQAIVDLHAEYPEHHVDEIARIIYAQFGRRPSAQTIKLTLANGPKPSRTTRRFPLWSQISDPRERRLSVVRLHAEGWTPTSIAGYLGTLSIAPDFWLILVFGEPLKTRDISAMLLPKMSQEVAQNADDAPVSLTRRTGNDLDQQHNRGTARAFGLVPR
jgi:hypothetical protein